MSREFKPREAKNKAYNAMMRLVIAAEEILENLEFSTRCTRILDSMDLIQYSEFADEMARLFGEQNSSIQERADAVRAKSKRLMNEGYFSADPFREV